MQDPRTRSTARVRRARIRVASGPEQGRLLEIKGDVPLVIGSQAPVDLHLSDPKVSRRHAQVKRAPGGWVLEDLGSTNGTYLEDLRIGSIYLGEGVVFRVGQTDIAFEGPEEEVSLAPASGEPGEFVASSPAMRELVAAVRQFAPTDLSVIIEGETGAGKEVVARALHRQSRRSTRPLVVVDCGALHEELTESELFGHERGAFTGAVEARAGAFESADGGTLFLDEIGELPLTLQPKLLRALETREVRRLGSNKVKTVDVRVLAATNRDLPAEISVRAFRADLFFRLSEVRLRIAPLRERPQDLVPLAEGFAREVDPSATFTPDAVEVLRDRSWPGNVRELRNIVRRATVAARGKPIAPEHLAPADLSAVPGAEAGPAIAVDMGLPIVESRETLLAAFNRLYLQTLMERHGGDLEAVARHAGVALNSIHRLLRKAGLKVPNP